MTVECKPTTIASRYSDSILQTGIAPSLDMFDIVNAQRNPADAYDNQQLLNVTNALNKALNKTDTSKYPLVKSRRIQSPILYSEIADFLTQTGLNINTVEQDLTNYADAIDAATASASNGQGNTEPKFVAPNAVSVEAASILSQLEFYYSGNIANSISGGFCSAIANPFGKLLAAIEALKFGGELLDKILNFDPKSLLGPLTTLETTLTKIVDTLKETLKKQVDGIVETAKAVIKNIKAGAKSIVKKLKKMVNNIKSFFSDTTMDNLKDKIKDFVKKSVDQFKETTPETIALLLFRFCQFTEMVQGFMKSPVDGLKAFVVNLSLEQAFIDKISKFRSQAAANAGAVRIDDEGIKESKERLVKKANEAALELDKQFGSGTSSVETTTQDIAVEDALPLAETYVASDEITDEENAMLAALGDDGMEGYFKFAPSVLNMGSDVDDATPGDGYRGIQNEMWYKFIPVCRRMGKTLTINSAYRSPKYNKKIGGAKNSFHSTGLAMDISMAGLSNDEIRKFIRIASQEGFMGIAYYSGSNFTHIDLGSRRTWTSGHRFDNYIAQHVQDAFRKESVSTPQVAKAEPPKPSNIPEGAYIDPKTGVVRTTDGDKFVGSADEPASVLAARKRAYDTGVAQTYERTDRVSGKTGTEKFDPVTQRRTWVAVT